MLYIHRKGSGKKLSYPLSFVATALQWWWFFAGQHRHLPQSKVTKSVKTQCYHFNFKIFHSQEVSQGFAKVFCILRLSFMRFNFGISSFSHTHNDTLSLSVCVCVLTLRFFLSLTSLPLSRWVLIPVDSKTTTSIGIVDSFTTTQDAFWRSSNSKLLKEKSSYCKIATFSWGITFDNLDAQRKTRHQGKHSGRWINPCPHSQ